MDQSFGGGAAGEWSFTLARPTPSGQLGAVPVASAGQDVAVAGEQRAGGDEAVGMAVTGEPEPDGATVRDIHLPRDERLPRIPNFKLVN